MGRPSIKKLKETHGKVETPTSQPTMLEQVWGYNSAGRYGTNDPKIYADKLSDMNRTDLEREARAYGEVVVEDSRRLIEALKKRFAAFQASLNKPVNPIKPAQLTDEARKILAEGR
jgi:hypothetical protein